MNSEEVKYRDFSHKLRNLLRLLKCPRVTLDEQSMVLMKNLMAVGESLRTNKNFADKYQIEQLLMRAQPVLEGRELSVSLSKISDDAPQRSLPRSAGSEPPERLDRESSSMQDSNKEPSEISENQNKGRLDLFTQFCRKNENRLLEVLLINKNLITDMEGNDSMYVVGSSEPREMKKIIMCGYMKFEAGQVINLNNTSKDFDYFINSQRYPVALSRTLAETEELDGAFLHSIVNLYGDLKLGLIRRGTRLLMFRLTNAGIDTLKKCTQKFPHSHGRNQSSSDFVSFFDENLVAKCIVDQKEMQTKIIRRGNQLNNVIRVVPGVQVSEKIEPKNENFKFTDKFYFSAQKYNKWPYLVLIPNEANVLATIHKMDRLEDVIEQYRDQRVVICCKSPKNIPGAFSRALLVMKNALACAISIRFKGNFFLMYKLSLQATEDKIQDALWDDIENGKLSAVYDKLYTYCAATAKEFEMKLATITDINADQT